MAYKRFNQVMRKVRYNSSRKAYITLPMTKYKRMRGMKRLIKWGNW